jgi:uncharacterized protein (TIGR03437 family)
MRRFATWTILLAGVMWAQTPPRVTFVFQEGDGGVGGGIASPGAIIGISGNGFNSLMSVTVGGLSVPVLSYSAQFIQARIPPGAAGSAAVSADLIVTTSAGASAPYTLTVAPLAPSTYSLYFGNPPILYHFLQKPDCCVGNAFPVPGDVVWMYVNGLGEKIPPPAPKLIIDDQEYPVLGTRTGILGFGGSTPGITCGPAGTPPFCSTQMPAIGFKIPDLQPGHHTLRIQAGGLNSQAITFGLNYSGIITSQSGLFFNAVQGGPAPLAQSFSVLSGSGTINFNLTVSTVSGGNWLSVDQQGGSVRAGDIGAPVKVSINPAGLAAGAYYGSIQVSANGVLNSPQSITVVLKIAAAGTPVSPYLDSSGLVFLYVQTGGTPATQTVTIANPSAANVTYTPSLSGGSQFKFSPTTAAIIPSGQSATLSINPTVAGTSPGVYTAKITLNFAGQSTPSVINLLLVVAAATSAKPLAPLDTVAALDAAAPLDAGGCTPTKLLPVFSQPGSGFNVAAAWPTPIIVSIADDCAVPLTTGNVSVTFSNGDPLLPLSSLRNGSWAATWSAVKPVTTGVNINVNAIDPASGLNGSVSLGGGVAANPDVPNLIKGGILDLASGGPALAPGSMIQVFGSKLASDSGLADSLPLPTLLHDATLLLGSKPLPLIYSSSGQVDAIIPYDVPQNTSLQMVARNGNALSSPQSVLLIPARPAIFTTNQSGQGQGHIYWFDDSGNQVLAGPKSPAKPGDTVVIYCMGLGVVDPPVQAGVASSLTALSSTVNPVTATVGGRTATVLFAGVTPGSTGLYQVNVTIPPGLPDNDATGLVLSSNGQDSVLVTLAVRSPK